jgi:hypothetical protein
LVTRKGTPLFQTIAFHNIWLYLLATLSRGLSPCCAK